MNVYLLLISSNGTRILASAIQAFLHLFGSSTVKRVGFDDDDFEVVFPFVNVPFVEL